MPTLDSISWEAISEERDHGVREAPGSGALHRLRLRDVPRRTWVLSGSMLPQSEVDDLEAVFSATRGAGLTTFTPPGESAVQVEFVLESDVAELDPVRVTASTYEVLIRVREVL